MFHDLMSRTCLATSSPRIAPRRCCPSHLQPPGCLAPSPVSPRAGGGVPGGQPEASTSTARSLHGTLREHSLPCNAGAEVRPTGTGETAPLQVGTWKSARTRKHVRSYCNAPPD
ncbi:hypothetical protein N658DRAFT_312699 [Parathielavia hyrcaniae]|uniref:Uncharacterized protein n=1 Tax=Parathielavia hyrcaniae TaxID=113614 RepID=A0AAN6PXF1_9PEZI|nr:hypothetical protein N658DRAFT_312699 [Parathielavia hyrcaniae]